MDAFQLCRATLLSAAFSLAIVSFGKTAGAVQYEISLHIVSEKGTDVILVSFKDKWNEAHASFSRILNQTRTAWFIRNSGLEEYVYKNALKNTDAVFVEADHNIDLRSIPMILHGLPMVHHCMRWLFLRKNFDMKQGDGLSSSDFPTCHEVELGAAYNVVNPAVATSQTPAKVVAHQLNEIHIEFRRPGNPGSKRLSGHRLTIGCLGYDNGRLKTTCRSPSYRSMIHLLRKTNLSVVVHSFPTESDILFELYRHRVDVALITTALKTSLLPHLDFINVTNFYEAFYSRESTTRFVSLIEVAGHSWSLVLALTLALICAFPVLADTRGQLKALSRNFVDKVMLLLAALLSTSAEEPPGLRNRTLSLRTFYAAWFVAVLPLSVYIRGEITARVTIKRPTDRMDTLQKLEDALDRHEVAPCVISNTLMHHVLEMEWGDTNEGALIHKLRAAYKRHGSRKLVRKDVAECLACALRNDHVCYYFQNAPCDVRSIGPAVREFKEHFKMRLGGFATVKQLRTFQVLRRFFRAVAEGELIRNLGRKCKDEIEESNVEYELWGFFLQYFVLLAASCAVLVSEIFVCWFSSKRTNILTFLKTLTHRPFRR